MLYFNDLTIAIVAQAIEEEFMDMVALPSPNCLSELHLFWRVLPNEFIENPIEFHTFLYNVIIPKIMNIQVCGIKGLKDYLFEYNSETGRVKLMIEGSNLIEMLNCPLFDSTTIISNNMWEIYHELGYEASRQYLINEFSNVLNSDGSNIDHAHIQLLVDVMCSTGNITSISRYGTRTKDSPMARASFEESLDNFLRAAIFGEKDNGDSVSASVMLAKLSKTGTGYLDLKTMY
eukprot:Pgem_evm11s16871